MDAQARLESMLRDFLDTVQQLCQRVAPSESGTRPDLGKIELAIRDAVQALAHQATVVVLEAYGTGRVGNRRPCACGGTQRFKVLQQKEVLDVHGGTLRFSRAYYYCEECRQGFLPLDEELGLGRQGISPALADLVEMMGVVAPFESASRLLERATGVCLSAERVRRTTERAGQRCLDVDQVEADRAVAAPMRAEEPALG